MTQLPFHEYPSRLCGFALECTIFCEHTAGLGVFTTLLGKQLRGLCEQPDKDAVPKDRQFLDG